MSRRTLFAAIVAAVTLVAASPSYAAIESRDILKTYFETGDVPTEDQFGTLIDSLINIADDKALLGVKVYDPQVSYAVGDTVIAQQTLYGATVLTPLSQCVTADKIVGSHLNFNMQHDFAGQHAFLELVFADSLGTYQGYMQLTMDPLPGGEHGPGIFVEYIVIETTPFTALTITEVPEPATLSLLAAGVAALLRRQRR